MRQYILAGILQYWFVREHSWYCLRRIRIQGEKEYTNLRRFPGKMGILFAPNVDLPTMRT
jgi:hypothetical protein